MGVGRAGGRADSRGRRRPRSAARGGRSRGSKTTSRVARARRSSSSGLSAMLAILALVLACTACSARSPTRVSRRVRGDWYPRGARRRARGRAQLIVRQGMRPVVIGMAIGLAGARRGRRPCWRHAVRPEPARSGVVRRASRRRSSRRARRLLRARPPRAAGRADDRAQNRVIGLPAAADYISNRSMQPGQMVWVMPRTRAPANHCSAAMAFLGVFHARPAARYLDVIAPAAHADHRGVGGRGRHRREAAAHGARRAAAAS